jgi:hypothetical protein
VAHVARVGALMTAAGAAVDLVVAAPEDLVVDSAADLVAEETLAVAALVAVGSSPARLFGGDLLTSQEFRWSRR